eukprot:745871-Hanusia_phi.AAC.3
MNEEVGSEARTHPRCTQLQKQYVHIGGYFVSYNSKRNSWKLRQFRRPYAGRGHSGSLALSGLTYNLSSFQACFDVFSCIAQPRKLPPHTQSAAEGWVRSDHGTRRARSIAISAGLYLYHWAVMTRPGPRPAAGPPGKAQLKKRDRTCIYGLVRLIYGPGSSGGNSGPGAAGRNDHGS